MTGVARGLMGGPSGLTATLLACVGVGSSWWPRHGAAVETQIEGAILTMHGMYGDLQGIVGVGTLPTLEPMDLPSLEGETDTPDSTNT